jgi:hypothetical protein
MKHMVRRVRICVRICQTVIVTSELKLRQVIVH